MAVHWGGRGPGHMSRLAKAAGGVSAALSLDLTTSLDPRITFTRASNATHFNSSGVLTLASTNTPRFDYDPVTLAAKGLLIEEARTNRLTYSANPGTDASWIVAKSTVTANAATGPAGANTATAWRETAEYLAKEISTNMQNFANSAESYSVHAKYAGRQWIYLRITDSTGTWRYAWFDIQNGVVGTVQTNLTAAITNCGGGIYRCVVKVTTPNWSNTRLTIGMTNADGDTAGNYLGDVTKGVDLYGAQLEAGTFPTSYIPTTSASATRAADVATMTGSNFSSWFNASEGTFVVEGDTIASGTRAVISADDNTANESIAVYASGTDPKFKVVDGGVTQCDIDAGAITAGTAFKFAGAYKVNDFGASVGGGAEVADTVGTLPTVDRLRIGVDQAGNYLNGHAKAITAYSTRSPTQALSA